MPIEVVVKEKEIAIYIDRERFAKWLQREGDVPWDGDPNSPGGENDKESEKSHGYRTVDGAEKPFPNPVNKGDTVAQVDNDTTDGINLFDEGPTGQKGTLQDAPQGGKKVREMRDWIKTQKFNYKNFCGFLYDMKYVAGFKLSTPLIGVTQQKKEPTLLQVAYRFYSYWLSAKDDIADQYKKYLVRQLEDMGIKIEMVKEALDGEEIDPENLPKGIEVST
jgi:hypothetical protein